MKILCVHGDQRGPGQGGGAESLLRDQAKGLKARGHEVAWWYGEGSIDRAVEQFKPDVLHFMTIHCYPMGMAPLVWAQEQGIPHLIHCQDYWPFCRPRMLLVDSDRSCSAVEGVCDNACGGREDQYLDIVNRSFVVAGNAYTADIYRRNGLRCDAVVELGVDTGMFAPDAAQRTPEVSVWTSTAWADQPVKGMHILREAVRGTGIAVNLMTHLTREQVAVGLKRAHVYVFPSVYEETFGLALCEAMASGCACIASSVAGARAQIEHGKTGFLVPPRHPEILQTTLQWLVESPIIREQLGQAARAHVEQEHSLEKMAARFEAVYQEVLHGS